MGILLWLFRPDVRFVLPRPRHRELAPAVGLPVAEKFRQNNGITIIIVIRIMPIAMH